MKKIHLLCNAHIDPVWLWQREEGIAEAISTFRVAADFCEKYDGFIFNHNESLLYEWVEENEPQLFSRIQKLVKEGKWHIMGGWYLQPDCLMPCGESFIRQIETGNKYFFEKFGVKPKTAINFDPFGHTRGLVQILKKSGYDSYLFLRPLKLVPENNFIWKGYDGSEVIGHCMTGEYGTLRGEIGDRFDWIIREASGDTNLMLWGIGNHGGGPSQIDLEYIESYRQEHPEMEIIHSFCENYFSEIKKRDLKVYDESLVHCNVGCYTTMSRIKQQHRKLESELNLCEKMVAVSGIEWDKEQFESAEKALMFSEFHDILPGTLIKEAEDDSLRVLNYGSEIASRICYKAFFKLCEGQKKAIPGEIPVLVFNPHPYNITAEIEVEFNLENKNNNDGEVTLFKVRNEKGEYIPVQNEKESSSINLDWRKRIVFKADLKPMCVNRFDCETSVEQYARRPIEKAVSEGIHFVFKNDKMEVRINKNTGLIDKYEVNGFNYLKDESARIDVYKDDEDPWGMDVDGFYDKIGEFKLVSNKEANEFNGYPDDTFENVRIIENGSVRCMVQAIFKYDKTYAVVTYVIPKEGDYIDVKIKMFSNNTNTMYKLSFDTNLENSDVLCQSAFGYEKARHDKREFVFQKWCGLSEGDKGFVVLNRGTYGGNAYKGILNISLLRTSVYSAHPYMGRPITDHDRYNEHIDMGERDFEFRLTADLKNACKDAEIYNQKCYAISFFPSGEGEKNEQVLQLTNENVILSCYKKLENKKLIRLYNSTDKSAKTDLLIGDNKFDVSFGAFEVKTYLYDENKLEACNLIGE